MSSLRLSIFLTLPVVGLAFLTGACGAPLAVTAGGYAADGTLMVTSDKSSSDHIASIVSKKDCALWRAFRGGDVCKERDGADPYAVDYDEPQRSVSEDGVKYGPPLRSSGEAPAASWDAAAYKTAVAPPPGPSTAVAEASPAPAPAPTVAAAPKRKKVKASRPPKKPSRGPAAPAA